MRPGSATPAKTVLVSPSRAVPMPIGRWLLAHRLQPPHHTHRRTVRGASLHPRPWQAQPSDWSRQTSPKQPPQCHARLDVQRRPDARRGVCAQHRRQTFHQTSSPNATYSPAPRYLGLRQAGKQMFMLSQTTLCSRRARSSLYELHWSILCPAANCQTNE